MELYVEMCDRIERARTYDERAHAVDIVRHVEMERTGRIHTHLMMVARE